MASGEKISASLYAAIIGDALGVPVESSSRQQLALASVKNMLGYGRYDQPEGTWSDDSSMILCTMESLCGGYNIDDLGAIFCKWLFEGYWTPTGFVFDAGLTTFMALESIRSDRKSARSSGCTSEDDNGNGSLMRILPAALYFAAETPHTFLHYIHEISAITHAHPRAKIGCGIYSLLIRALLNQDDKNDAYRRAVADALACYEPDETLKPELKHYARILSHQLPALKIDDIRSSGYVVHTLEAAVWCFLRNDDTKGCLLDAVNLGLDTDTTGTVAGGLAGLYYGIDSLPAEWIAKLARKDEIDACIARFVAIVRARLDEGERA